MTKLDELVGIIGEESVYIQTHNYPDQDALASAYGLKCLLEAKGIEATICYKGQVDKLNTIAMMEDLNIAIVYIDDDDKMDETSKIIIVDGQKGNANVEDFIGDEVACIDHHKMQETDMYQFFDIRSDVGACSSIIASYFVENNIEMPINVATALLYGIKMDTNNLSREVSDLDIDMFYMLFKKANRDSIRKFDCCSLQMEDLKAYSAAIENLRVFGNVGIVNIGKDCGEAILGTMSDFIMSLDEVTFSVVYSYRAGGIKFSVRNEEIGLDAAAIIRECLKDYGGGGGHATMAAGFVPNVTEDEARNISRAIEERIIEMATIK
ncbi:MAG: DHH family phosphoesterase [Lachnospiraceae bacterium]|nr:DHH family phosphoesterase [Lachnospiraceae bacterium]MEE0685655.1 DHH family phosphoesterase [Lachnospiraceae bacterium]